MLSVAVAICCVACSGLAPAAAQQANARQAHGRHAEERQVQALEQQWRQAALSGDTSTIEKLLDDDFIGINSSGLIYNRDQQLERMRNRAVMVTKMDVTDVKVKLIGAIAIVTSRVDLEGTSEGVSVTGVYRYTRVYRRLPSGAWKVTNFEATHINPNPGRLPASVQPVPPRAH
jgi:ketosteroid isomerase-like protein